MGLLKQDMEAMDPTLQSLQTNTRPVAMVAITQVLPLLDHIETLRGSEINHCDGKLPIAMGKKRTVIRVNYYREPSYNFKHYVP